MLFYRPMIKLGLSKDPFWHIMFHKPNLLGSLRPYVFLWVFIYAMLIFFISMYLLVILCFQGVIEFSMCLFFAKLVSYTFLYWLPLYINESSKYTHTRIKWYKCWARCSTNLEIVQYGLCLCNAIICKVHFTTVLNYWEIGN